MGVDKAADSNTALCSWQSKMDRLRNTFGRHALPMVWDYAETNPFAEATGDIFSAMHTIAKVLERLPASVGSVPEAAAYQRNAMARGVGPKPTLVCTDPPYYDNIAYAELSDFFFVWLRRSLNPHYQLGFCKAVGDGVKIGKTGPLSP